MYLFVIYTRNENHEIAISQRRTLIRLTSNGDNRMAAIISYISHANFSNSSRCIYITCYIKQFRIPEGDKNYLTAEFLPVIGIVDDTVLQRGLSWINLHASENSLEPVAPVARQRRAVCKCYPNTQLYSNSRYKFRFSRWRLQFYRSGIPVPLSPRLAVPREL